MFMKDAFILFENSPLYKPQGKKIVNCKNLTPTWFDIWDLFIHIDIGHLQSILHSKPSFLHLQFLVLQDFLQVHPPPWLLFEGSSFSKIRIYYSYITATHGWCLSIPLLYFIFLIRCARGVLRQSGSTISLSSYYKLKEINNFLFV